jgi:hypothetical protein
MLRCILILAAAGWLCGCAPPPLPPPQPIAKEKPIVAAPAPSLDAAPATPVIFHVEIFVLGMPRGTFSSNEAFWKRIDEQCVDVATADLLYKNGFRVGVAPLAELDDFAKYMNGISPVEKIAVTGAELKNVQVEMKGKLSEQCIFYYDRTNTLIGNVYDQSDNIMNVSFEPAPRKPEQLRLTLCPMVRETRRHLMFTQLNDTYEMKFVDPEMYYDLNCRVDIPRDGFLVLTPSPKVSLPSIIGKAFLTKDGPTDQLEQVLIVIPRQLKVEQPPAHP